MQYFPIQSEYSFKSLGKYKIFLFEKAGLSLNPVFQSRFILDFFV
ncbi:hypothetical protein B4064_3133 [Caldibacillus thermoamylovorans]|nr:hypothetical protein B4064_3133 [Caldibacillus thermoamylovorans]KIO67212.1 hypothetical protein B4065_1988 [Caldibacillus thermoamylovorans]